MNIYLIGFMGSGKTNMGRLISNQLEYKFCDLDEMFEERYHFTVGHFFETFGEAEFRKIERNLLLSTVNFSQSVISTGGGTPCFFENIDFIKQNGLSVYFRLTAPQLISRLKQSKKPRPLIRNFQGEELDKQIITLLEHREPFYLKADLIIDGFNTSAPEISRTIRNYLSSR